VRRAARAQDGNTSLHAAAMSGSVELATLLLERGADANATDKARVMRMPAARRRVLALPLRRCRAAALPRHQRCVGAPPVERSSAAAHTRAHARAHAAPVCRRSSICRARALAHTTRTRCSLRRK
jgi:hypothetical protein